MASSNRNRGAENLQYKAAERKEFFKRLDKGGTIRAVAIELGISLDSAYRWRREAGVSTPRKANREYCEVDKAEFFRLLGIRRNVSVVAKELGFVRVTCYKWAHAAEIFTGREVSTQREEFLRLRATGLSRAQTAAHTNVDKRTAQDWDKGIRQFSGGRLYPDGRIVRYDMKAVVANAKSPRNIYTRGNLVALDKLDRPVNPRYLSLVQREQIHDLRVNGSSIRSIARELGRSASTISREVTRNTRSSVGYLPYGAHRAATVRREGGAKFPKDSGSCNCIGKPVLTRDVTVI